MHRTLGIALLIATLGLVGCSTTGKTAASSSPHGPPSSAVPTNPVEPTTTATNGGSETALREGPVSNVTAGNNTPQAAIVGYYEGLVTDQASIVCQYLYLGVDKADCEDGESLNSGIKAPPNGYMFGNSYIAGNEALVTALNSVCTPGNPCETNSDPNAGLPATPSGFDAAWKTALAGNESWGIACIKVDGLWYADGEVANGG